MARPDNANGARAKLREAAVIPVSTPLVRLYSEYIHAEYGDLDRDSCSSTCSAGGPGRRCATRRCTGWPPVSPRAPGSLSRCTCCVTRTPPSFNSGVPQHVVQKLLGHASPHMTAHSARGYPRHHHPRGVRSLPAPAGQHRRPGPRLRPGRAHRGRRMGQAQPVPDQGQPAERLLRPTAAARLPSPQRLPDLPRLPDHPRIPRHPPPPGHHQPAPAHPRRSQRPDPPGR